jgi:phage baseplate assembly protein V
VTDRVYGIVVGTVTDVDDPEAQGRIRVDLSFMPGGNTRSYWAPVVMPMAGKDRGCWLFPEIGDEAVVAFDHGDTEHPYIMGFTWNGVDRPPSTTPKERVIRSLNGHTIRMLDSTLNGGNKGALVVEDAHGNSIVMTNTHVIVHSEGVLILDAKTISLRSAGVDRVVTPSGNPI